MTYILTGTQSWTNPNGDVVNVTIVPTLVTGTFTDLPGAATPEPVTGPVVLLALAGTAVANRLRRMVNQ